MEYTPTEINRIDRELDIIRENFIHTMSTEMVRCLEILTADQKIDFLFAILSGGLDRYGVTVVKKQEKM
jgi:hypothetical protein